MKAIGVEDLPVEALRIDGESARTLRRLGLKTVGALLDLPRASLARRFRGETIGENVLIRLDEMMGAPRRAAEPAQSAHLLHGASRADGAGHHAARGWRPSSPGWSTALSRDLETKAQGATAPDPQAVPHRWLARQPAGGLFRRHP